MRRCHLVERQPGSVIHHHVVTGNAVLISNIEHPSGNQRPAHSVPHHAPFHVAVLARKPRLRRPARHAPAHHRPEILRKTWVHRLHCRPGRFLGTRSQWRRQFRSPKNFPAGVQHLACCVQVHNPRGIINIHPLKLLLIYDMGNAIMRIGIFPLHVKTVQIFGVHARLRGDVFPGDFTHWPRLRRRQWTLRAQEVAARI